MSDCNCTSNSGSSASSEDKKFLMVEATSAEAANCPSGAAQAISSEECTKDDRTYDKILSDIGMPAIGTSVEALVCNGALYRVNQYVRFLESGAALRIIAIDGNRLQFFNGGCDGTNPLPGNPAPGTVIDRNAYFYAIDEPYCQSVEERKEEMEAALAEFEELCMPNLVDADNTDKQRPVGFTVENAVNTGFKKCMRKVLGWFYKGGHAYYENPDELPEANLSDYRPLYRNTSDGKIVERKKESEVVGSSGKYVRVVGDGNSVYIEGVMLFVPTTPRVIKETGPNIENTNFNIAISASSEYSEEFVLNYSEVTNLLDKMFDGKFYALIDITVGMKSNAFGATVGGDVSLNDEVVMSVASNQLHLNSVVVPVEVDKSDKKLKVQVHNMRAAGAGNMFIRVKLIGLYI